MEFLIYYSINVLIVVSILLIWFQSAFPYMVLLNGIKHMGLKRNDLDFYDVGYGSDYPIGNWTNNEWLIFCNKLGIFGHLLTCKYCFSCHLIFWVNIITFIISLPYINISLLALILSITTQLPAVHLLYNIILAFPNR